MRCRKLPQRSKDIGNGDHRVMSVKMRSPGRSGIRVSEIGFGAWGIGGGWGATDDAEAKRALHRYLDLGGNFLDTAYAYGDGHSVRLIAAVLVSARRRAIPNRLSSPARCRRRRFSGRSAPICPSRIAFRRDHRGFASARLGSRLGLSVVRGRLATIQL